MHEAIFGQLSVEDMYIEHSRLVAGAMQSAALSGTISRLTGGKFANGAVTGAFQFVMNACLSSDDNCFGQNDLATLQAEIYDDANTRRDELDNLMANKDWAKIRELYPHIAKSPDTSLGIHFEALNLRTEFNRIAGLTMMGKTSAGLKTYIAKPANAALSLMVDRSPRTWFGSFVDVFYSRPLPVQHQFIYENHLVNIKYIERTE